MTDPSYAGQVITFTFPHVGNVGANPEDEETLDPVALGIPDYLTVIKKPMDLGTVASYLRVGHYSQVKHMLSDVLLVLENAKVYNPAKHPVHVAAQTLRSVYDRELTTMRQRWMVTQRANALAARERHERQPPISDLTLASLKNPVGPHLHTPRLPHVDLGDGPLPAPAETTMELDHSVSPTRALGGSGGGSRIGTATLSAKEASVSPNAVPKSPRSPRSGTRYDPSIACAGWRWVAARICNGFS